MGNLWRTSKDIQTPWDSIVVNVDSVIGLAMHAGPGGWNDPDMLQIGNSEHVAALSRARAHFGLWAITKAPLLISAPVLEPQSLEVLLAKEVIAINQDALGIAGDLIYVHGSIQVRPPVQCLL
jgi:alpha-galactosidase